MKIFYRLYSWFTGTNAKNTPPDLIKEQLTEKRALPVGMTEFHEWSDRIFAGAMIPGLALESAKYTLANIILNLSPVTAFETDLYFIHALRKFAANQVADGYRKELYEAKKAKLALEQEKQNQGEGTPLRVVGEQSMAKSTIQGTQT